MERRSKSRHLLMSLWDSLHPDVLRTSLAPQELLRMAKEWRKNPEKVVAELGSKGTK
jgi:hypothetical protein